MLDPTHYAQAAADLLEVLEDLHTEARAGEAAAITRQEADYWHARAMLLCQLDVVLMERHHLATVAHDELPES